MSFQYEPTFVVPAVQVITLFDAPSLFNALGLLFSLS